MLTIRDEYEKMYLNIKQVAVRYLRENRNLKSLVVGISGGIDSALVTVLAHEVLKEFSDVSLIGRSIPIDTTTNKEIERGKYIGEHFCDEFEVKDLTKAYQNLYQELVGEHPRLHENTMEEKIRRGNLKARVRMTYLFDLAHFRKGMVLSTDNYTELLLGFWTLHGDVGNYGFIQYLWKTEVYGLAGFLANHYESKGDAGKAEALRDCIAAVPTDGLGITGSDFDQIGVTDYETADRLLIEYLKGNSEKADHPTIRKHIESAYKRLDPQNICREDIFGV